MDEIRLIHICVISAIGNLVMIFILVSYLVGKKAQRVIRRNEDKKHVENVKRTYLDYLSLCKCAEDVLYLISQFKAETRFDKRFGIIERNAFVEDMVDAFISSKDDPIS